MGVPLEKQEIECTIYAAFLHAMHFFLMMNTLCSS